MLNHLRGLVPRSHEPHTHRSGNEAKVKSEKSILGMKAELRYIIVSWPRSQAPTHQNHKTKESLSHEHDVIGKGPEQKGSNLTFFNQLYMHIQCLVCMVLAPRQLDICMCSQLLGTFPPFAVLNPWIHPHTIKPFLPTVLHNVYLCHVRKDTRLFFPCQCQMQHVS